VKNGGTGGRAGVSGKTGAEAGIRGFGGLTGSSTRFNSPSKVGVGTTMKLLIVTGANVGHRVGGVR
jgi:hypothetical protein